MKHIPTLFLREPGLGGRLTGEVNPQCQWVLDGQGIATRQFDGIACLFAGHKLGLYTRHLRRLTHTATLRVQEPGCHRVDSDYAPGPQGWISATDMPPQGGYTWPGWRPVLTQEIVYWAALRRTLWGFLVDDTYGDFSFDGFPVGTYELVGPLVADNAEGFASECLLAHGCVREDNSVRDIQGLYVYLKENFIEGIVWQHPDGRRAKIQRRDFGLPWPVSSAMWRTSACAGVCTTQKVSEKSFPFVVMPSTCP